MIAARGKKRLVRVKQHPSQAKDAAQRHTSDGAGRRAVSAGHDG